MKISTKHHKPHLNIILVLTFIGSYIYHQFTHGFRDWLTNGLYISGDPDIGFLFSNLGWWPKYFLIPFLIALLISYRLRFYQITISDSPNPAESFKEIVHILDNGSKVLIPISNESENCTFRAAPLTMHGSIFGTDNINVNLQDGKIEIVGRKKFLAELEEKLTNIPTSP
ncbi:hypothetical protein [Litoribacter populi]|uniref:hypothetical protein n=1 Tax=Litoribacter populi TaxID=2598460 RepID=UPI00117C822D|nr:hypothetical protein [Litoribacter populi]